MEETAASTTSKLKEAVEVEVEKVMMARAVRTVETEVVVVEVEEPQDEREELLATLQRIDRRLTALKAQLKAD